MSLTDDQLATCFNNLDATRNLRLDCQAIRFAHSLNLDDFVVRHSVHSDWEDILCALYSLGFKHGHAAAQVELLEDLKEGG